MWLGALVVVLAAATPLGWVGAADAAAGQDDTPTPRQRVVLVGDSIMLGAAPNLEQAFTSAGFDVVVDASVSRSTPTGAAAVAGHLAAPTDAVVIMLGANDAGDPSAYRESVREVVSATALVPNVYWMTIPEVRDYYPAANQVVREELALRPGAEVLDWSAVSSGPGVTAGDGLHLTPAGADVMGWFVMLSVADDLLEPPATTSTTTITATTVPTKATTPTSGGDPGAGDDGSGRAGPGGSVPVAEDPARSVETGLETAADSSVRRLATSTAAAYGAVLVLLAVSGFSLAVWALWRTRGRAASSG